LVLFENPAEPGTINHLGVEVFSTQEVNEATGYLQQRGFATDIEEQTTCCHAVQDKVWVTGPDESRWEVYTVLADAPVRDGLSGDATCCVTQSEGAAQASACC